MVLQACSTNLSRTGQFIQVLPGSGEKGPTLQLILRRQHNPEKFRQRHYIKGNHRSVSLVNIDVEIPNTLANQLCV